MLVLIAEHVNVALFDDLIYSSVNVLKVGAVDKVCNHAKSRDNQCRKHYGHCNNELLTFDGSFFLSVSLELFVRADVLGPMGVQSVAGLSGNYGVGVNKLASLLLGKPAVKFISESGGWRQLAVRLAYRHSLA